MQNCTAVDEALNQRLGVESPAFVGELLPQLVELVRCARRLPLGEEHAIRRSSRDFLMKSQQLSQRSLAVAHRALTFVDPSSNQSSTAEELSNFNVMVESIDGVLERVDVCLRNAAAGVGAEVSAEQDETEAAGAGTSSSTFGTRSSIPKPQVRWRQLIENERTVFVPRLLVKHHAKKQLDARIVAAQQKVGIRGGTTASAPASAPAPGKGALLSHLESLGVGRRPEDSDLPHPYIEELAALSWPDSFFAMKKAERFGRVEDTPLVYVKTEKELREMIEEIKATCSGKEVAIDVEHHDLRSYKGFVCLVQVSSRHKDWIVDPFNIFEQMHLLNEVTTDPNIIKVLHGSDSDVMWLQRDFSIYFVNMFDTGQATRVLKLQGGYSYANLVNFFCGVKLDKKYQTADWRERPLPAEMIHYARADTHYLLFCFDCLRNALLAQRGGVTGFTGLSLTALEGGEAEPTDEGVAALLLLMEKSAALCRMQYREAPFDAGNMAMMLSERFSSKAKPLEPRQFGALKALLQWRDCLARTMDESLNFVASDACLWRIALALPSTPARLRSCVNPLPAMLHHHANEVVELISKSAASTEGTSTSTETAAGAHQVSTLPITLASTVTSPPTITSQHELAVPTSEWPARTAKSAAKPVVQVSATTASKRQAALATGALPRTCAVLCAFMESDDEEEDLLQSLAAPNPVKAVEVIKKNIRFAAVAPAVTPEALAATAAAEEVAKAAALAEAAAEAAASLPEALPGATTLRGKRKRRGKQTTTPNLEDVAMKTVTTDPYGGGVLPPMPVAQEPPADPIAEEEYPLLAASQPKKKRKVKKVERAVIDPYM